ncbi:SDR family NAD(P)-dependent oxidoreductase [Niallia sp. Krafla_26]|uniref:SDR family NAD(P)-dependent oxidoreductase n=1 Tax=Niallia sp. Krafla_26 TaxID=3064703 RepID=UPI003D17157B
MKNERLRHKNIIITGASSGVGLSIAEKCATSGANVILLARRLDVLKEIQEDLQNRYSVRVMIFKLDVSDTDEVKNVFQQIFQEIGEIDILVNNAGFGIFRSAHELSIEEIKGMFSVNVMGLIACTNMVLPIMLKQGKGHIINIASQAGKIATPKSSAYAATKHAVLGFTNSLRMEVSDRNIFVTAVNPGPIETNFFKRADETGNYEKSVKRVMITPDYVASKVVGAMLTKRREINLPGWMNAGSILFALFPGLFEKAGKPFLNKK